LTKITNRLKLKLLKTSNISGGVILNSSITLKKTILYAIIGGLLLSAVAHVYSNPFSSAKFHAKSRQPFNLNDHKRSLEKEPIGSKLTDEQKQKIQQDVDEVFINRELNEKLEQILKDKANHQLPPKPQMDHVFKETDEAALNIYGHNALPTVIRQLDYTQRTAIHLLAKAFLHDKINEHDYTKATELIMQIREIREILKTTVATINQNDEESFAKTRRLSNICFCLAESLDKAVSSNFKKIEPVNEETNFFLGPLKFIPSNEFKKLSMADFLEFTIWYNNKLLRQIGDKTQLIGAPWYKRAFYTVTTDGPSYLLGAAIAGMMCSNIEDLANFINSYRS
jgi:hypothetical protein